MFTHVCVLLLQTEEDSETESSDDEESGVKRGEPNKFDALCDGLLNAMALVHSALKEVRWKTCGRGGAAESLGLCFAFQYGMKQC